MVRLAKVIEQLGPIKGERSLQKLIYLFDSQNNQLGYSFLWKTYGPVSFELQQDIAELRALGLVTSTRNSGITVYDVPVDLSKVAPFWTRKLAECEFDQKSTRIIKHLLKIDRRQDPLFLEVIASLDFLEKRSSPDPVTSLRRRVGNRFSMDFIKDSQSQWHQGLS